VLPSPTFYLVKEECNAFDDDSSTQLGEEALRQLREQFPLNADPSRVLLKILVLNKLYNARVDDVDVFLFARHIAGLDVDSFLNRGSLDVVRLIWDCPSLGKKYYSFATKFCSWHNPTAYPIYDGNVDVCLWSYKKQYQFATFHRQDLGYYEKLVGIVDEFRHRFDLNGFTYREIDKFLWRSGGRILRGED
jgi:hypothetical protein